VLKLLQFVTCKNRLVIFGGIAQKLQKAITQKNEKQGAKSCFFSVFSFLLEI